jgi:hypothetical protein
MVTPKGSILIDRESLQVILCTRHRGVLAGFTARGLAWKRIRNHSVSWNLPKLSHLWRCNRDFGRCRPVHFAAHRQPLYLNFMYHSRIVLSAVGSVWYVVRNLRYTVTNGLSFDKFQDTERFLFPCPRHVSSGLPHPPSGETCKYATAPSTHKKKLEEILYLFICSPSARPSRLLYRRGGKSRRDLWITMYINNHSILFYVLNFYMAYICRHSEFI